MNPEIIEFTVHGSPRALAPAIEQHAAGMGSLQAIVVPWESDNATVSIAVTSAKGEGWAIEHTNLGTVKLTDIGNNTTRISIMSHQPEHTEGRGMLALFDGFARQIQSKLQVAS
jgi:hypothetical protein